MNDDQQREQRIASYVAYCNTKKGDSARKTAINAYMLLQGLPVGRPPKKKISKTPCPPTVFKVRDIETHEEAYMTHAEIKGSEVAGRLAIVLDFN